MDARLLVVIAMGLGALRAEAYPIPPQPLWNLVDEAEVVMIATVGRTWRDALTDDDVKVWRDRDRVALTPIEILKGDVSGEAVVEYSAAMACPAPARYLTGKRVLTFLVRGPDGHFIPVGLSYGTVYPDDAGIDAFRTRIREAIALQSDPPVSNIDKVDWHIRATAHPATRWDGLWPLVHTETPEEESAIATRLLPAQRSALRRVFLKEAPHDATLALFLEALKSDHSKQVDAVAIARVGAMDPSLTRQNDRWLAVVALLDRLDEQELLADLKDDKIDMGRAWYETSLRHSQPTSSKQKRAHPKP